jgi:sphinganine-1-phosphate aldolase
VIGLTVANASSLRNIIFVLFLLRWIKKSFYLLRGHGLVGTLSLASSRVYKATYKLLMRAPGVRSRINKQIAAAVKDIEHKVAPQVPGVARYLTVPKEPWPAEQLTAELAQLAEMKRTRWEDGKVSGAVYHGGMELLRLQATAMEMFGVANPIHPDVFPAVRKMEAEVVAMVQDSESSARTADADPRTT